MPDVIKIKRFLVMVARDKAFDSMKNLLLLNLLKNMNVGKTLLNEEKILITSNGKLKIKDFLRFMDRKFFKLKQVTYQRDKIPYLIRNT